MPARIAESVAEQRPRLLLHNRHPHPPLTPRLPVRRGALPPEHAQQRRDQGRHVVCFDAGHSRLSATGRGALLFTRCYCAAERNPDARATCGRHMAAASATELVSVRMRPAIVTTGVGVFVACLCVHALIWRLWHPRRDILTLLVIFYVVPGIGCLVAVLAW